MRAARSRPHISRISVYIGPAPAMKNPPLRPVAPLATVRRSSTSTDTPRRASRQAVAMPPMPAPITQTSHARAPSSGGRGSYGSSCQRGVVASTPARLPSADAVEADLERAAAGAVLAERGAAARAHRPAHLLVPPDDEVHRARPAAAGNPAGGSAVHRDSDLEA